MLEGILFTTLLLVAGAILVSGLMKRGGYVQIPFLFAAVFLGWVIPQLWSLKVRQVAPGDSLNALLLMSLLCLVAAVFGWWLAFRGRSIPIKRYLPEISETDVRKAAVILTGVALVAFMGLGFAPGAEQESSLWTGRSTIFYFVLNLKSISIALALILFLKRRTTFTVTLLAINVMMFFPYVLILFKRRQIAEILLVGAYALLLVRNVAIPRVVVVAAFVMAAFGTFAAGELRSITKDGELPTIAEISEIDFLALSPINDPTASPEITNAANLVFAIQVTGDYTLGGQMWNRFVFQYVPGQFVGFDAKRGLMVTPWPEEVMYDTTRYVTPTGTTQTGIATAYMEFGYLGFLFFLLNGYIMGQFWRLATTGNSWDKVWYAAGMVPSFISITAHSAYFYVAFLLFFLVLAFVAFALRASFGKKRPTADPAPRIGVNARAYRRG